MDFQSLDLLREGFLLLGSLWCGTVAWSVELVHCVLNLVCCGIRGQSR